MAGRAREGNPIDGNDARLPYYAAAMEILTEGGYGALSMRPLCRRMKLTTGAFYYSFTGWPDFTTQFFEFWRNERTTRLGELAQSQTDPFDRLQFLLKVATELPHRAEAAMRVWSSVDPRLGAVQRQVDDERFDILHDAMRACVGDDDAEIFTRWGLLQLVGYEQSQDHDIEFLHWTLDRVFDAVVRHSTLESKPL